MQFKSMALKKQEKGKADTMVQEPEGLPVHLSHEHIQRLGLDGPLDHDTPVEFGGKGKVTESGSRTDADGNTRHHMTIVLTNAGLDARERADERRTGIRGDIDKAVEKTGDAKAGVKIPEEKGGK